MSLSDEATGTAQAQVRYCRHYQAGVPGGFSTGSAYVAALQRLKVSAAMRAAQQVEPFFWADADKMRVWLCADCATDLGLPAA